jgi:hypothetical protein
LGSAQVARPEQPQAGAHADLEITDGCLPWVKRISPSNQPKYKSFMTINDIILSRAKVMFGNSSLFRI